MLASSHHEAELKLFREEMDLRFLTHLNMLLVAGLEFVCA
jgi:hypothetical protein